MMIILLSWLAMIVCSANSMAPDVLVRHPRNETALIAQFDKQTASDILLKVSFDGGLVPDKGAGHTGHSEFVVTREGKYSFAGDVTKKRKGKLQASELNELVFQIKSADFAALRSRKFTGQCLTATDGDEVTYSFQTQTGLEVMASCKIAIDVKSPLFIKVGEILRKYWR